MGSLGFVFPTTLLPLYHLQLFHPRIDDVIFPRDPNVYRYILTMFPLSKSHSGTSLPFEILPEKQEEVSPILNRLFTIFTSGQNYDIQNKQAFRYWTNELVDNIYDHSEFSYSFVMAQRYPNMKFMETSFFDDGVTIAGSFEKIGKKYRPEQHFEAINAALEGESSKDPDERGHGLRTSVNIILQGLKGEVLIVSGGGAVYLRGNERQPYVLGKDKSLKGTMISFRVSTKARITDLYKYLE